MIFFIHLMKLNILLGLFGVKYFTLLFCFSNNLHRPSIAPIQSPSGSICQNNAIFLALCIACLTALLSVFITIFL